MTSPIIQRSRRARRRFHGSYFTDRALSLAFGIAIIALAAFLGALEQGGLGL